MKIHTLLSGPQESLFLWRPFRHYFLLWSFNHSELSFKLNAFSLIFFSFLSNTHFHEFFIVLPRHSLSCDPLSKLYHIFCVSLSVIWSITIYPNYFGCWCHHIEPFETNSSTYIMINNVYLGLFCMYHLCNSHNPER